MTRPNTQGDAAAKAPMPIVVLISGQGSNLQAIIDATQCGELPVAIKAVICNRPGAYGLQRAEQCGIPALTIDHTKYDDRPSFDLALQQAIDTFRPGLIVLAGFMRILGSVFIEYYKNRIMNIHPSLLPKYTGLATHQRALKASDSEHGASVHFVTNDLDGGPVIIQARFAITPEDNVGSLTTKVQAQEYLIYPLAIAWFAKGRLKLEDEQVIIDDKLLNKPVDYAEIK